MTGTEECDVLVVGAGPVGLVTAGLLGRHGWRVTVLERWPEPYPRPRAVHFDDEVARLLAGAGVDPVDPRVAEPAEVYDWRSATGETLLHFDWSGRGPSGWPVATMFHQPDLERALADAAAAHASVSVRRGHEVGALRDDGDRVLVSAVGPAGPVTVAASWVVGCDGANSLVRRHTGVGVTDLGFSSDWLILDVVPHERRRWEPDNLQICDPAGPTTLVSGGPGRRRWEFMRGPGEDLAALDTEATAWARLAPWGLRPDNATLDRHVVYTFQARWAQDWRRGRVLLAGDAAHLMPPFAGQGMCSGIRDAANLAWKLDLVLAGHAGTSLLDTYTTERRAHVQHAIGMSVELGRVICVTDPDAAAERDASMVARRADPAAILPPLPPPMLTEGLLHRAPDGTPTAGAGLLCPQGRVRHRGRGGMLDDVVGTGRFLVTASVDPAGVLSADQQAFLVGIGARLLHLLPADAAGESEGEHAVVDVDDVALPHLADGGHLGAVVRPDHHLFGCASTAAELAALVDDLRRQLEAAPPPAIVPRHAPPVPEGATSP